MENGMDKVLHFLAYGGLALLLGIWRGPERWMSSFAIIAVYAVVDELLQIPVGRSCEVADGVADWLGATAGGLLAWAVSRRFAGKASDSEEADFR